MALNMLGWAAAQQKSRQIWSGIACLESFFHGDAWRSPAREPLKRKALCPEIRSFLYTFLTRSDPFSNGAFTQPYGSVQHSNLGSLAMLDLLYIVLGLAVFAAFTFGIRAAERL
jgi:hypothetical protein